MLVLGGQSQCYVSEAAFKSYHLAAKLRQLRNKLFQPVCMPCALLRSLYIHCSLPPAVGHNKRRANPRLRFAVNKNFTFQDIFVEKLLGCMVALVYLINPTYGDVKIFCGIAIKLLRVSQI
jgi:hypothetical protein